MNKTEIQYSIKYFLLTILGNLVMVIFGFYLLFLINIRELRSFEFSDYFILIIAILFIFKFGKIIINEFLNLNKKIVFSELGIEYNEKLYQWHNIKNAEIIYKKDYTSKYRLEYKEFFLSFLCEGKITEIKIDNYKTSENELSDVLKRYMKNFSQKQ